MTEQALWNDMEIDAEYCLARDGTVYKKGQVRVSFGDLGGEHPTICWQGPEDGVMELSDQMRPAFIRALLADAVPWPMEEIASDPLHERSYWRRRANG